MERLRIEYGTGYMELIVEAFFPCKMPAMRKAARLIIYTVPMKQGRGCSRNCGRWRTGTRPYAICTGR